MIVRYRLVEDWLTDEGSWFLWGMFYENRSEHFADYTLLVCAVPDDDRRKGRYFDRRIRELRPSIEEAEAVLGEYTDRYRVLPEIRTVEGADHREIFKQLWDILSEETEKQRVERHAIYAVPEPAYHAVHEKSNQANDKH